MAWVSDSSRAIRATRAGKPGLRRWTAAVRIAALMSAVLIAGGLASAPQALAATAPNVPTNVTATAGNASATLTWMAPVDTGGSPVLYYTIIPDPACGTCVGLTATGLSPTSTVIGLTNGQAYKFTVTATNLTGTSAPSVPSNTVTPAASSSGPTAKPNAPTAVNAVAGKASAAVSWKAPADNGGLPVLSYAITPNPACTGCGGLTTPGVATTSTVTGLTNGQAYTFTVTATSPAGQSGPSDASNAVTPTAPPGAPTAVTAAAGNASATVSWTVPADSGGSPITGYTIIPNPACAGCGGLSPTGPSSIVTGLTNGQAYTFTVTATNAVGPSPASAASNAVTPLMAGFTGTAPARVLDTRFGTGAPAAKLGAGGTLTLTLTNLPTGTTAVTMNVTVTNPTDVSYLSVYPGGGPRPFASNLNFGPDQTVPNMVQVPVGPNNTVTFYNNQGTVDVVADLLGDYATGSGAGFTGTAPARVLNTRSGVGAPQATLGAGGTLTLTIPNLPSGTTAVAMNVTVTNPTDVSYLTVYPAGAIRPLASNLNYGPNQTVPNMVLVPVGPNNTVTFYNNQGTADVIADLLGFFE